MNFTNSTSDNHHRINKNFNRLSLFNINQNEEYDFFNAEKIHRSNSLKKQKSSPSTSTTNLSESSNHQNEFELDSISERAFAISRRFPNLNFRKKQRANSININPADLRDNILNFDGALYYLSKTKGLAGSLKLSSMKIVFTNCLAEMKNNHKLKHNFFKPRFPNNPIQESEDQRFFEIDLMNIAELSREIMKERSLIHIHCKNFKHATIGLKDISANSLYNRLIVDHQINFDSKKHRRSFLWEYLWDEYHYRLRSDWVRYEKWYVNNFKIQFSQFNEIGICPSLPEIVIVPRKVDDKELNSIVNISDGQRVPIITYLYRQSGHMVIRSTTFNSNRLSLHDLYNEKIFNGAQIPLVEVDISTRLPSIDEIEKYHLKLRKTCFKAVKMNQNNDISIHYDIDYCKQFWSKCGSWLYSLSKLLTLIVELVDTIKRNASVGLLEKFDCNWNCLLSSLIQINIDTEKRTIKGFEQLLSKEWLYLSGYKRLERGFGQQTLKSLNEPNHILFVLFLDAVHQMIVQNPTSFEFSTFYLILLLDNQVSSDLLTKDKCAEFELDKTHPLIKNPLFVPSHKRLKLKTHITNLKLFTKLFFRSLGSSINRYTTEELLYIKELENGVNAKNNNSIRANTPIQFEERESLV